MWLLMPTISTIPITLFSSTRNTPALILKPRQQQKRLLIMGSLTKMPKSFCKTTGIKIIRTFWIPGLKLCKQAVWKILIIHFWLLMTPECGRRIICPCMTAEPATVIIPYSAKVLLSSIISLMTAFKIWKCFLTVTVPSTLRLYKLMRV